jgi:signal transduction histidine kinase
LSEYFRNTFAKTLPIIKSSFILSCFVLFSLQLLAGNKIIIGPDFDSVSIASQSFVFGSYERIEDIDSVIKISHEQWQQVPEKGFRKPYNEIVWWMKFEVKCTENGMYFLENHYTMLEDYILYVVDSRNNITYYGNLGIRNFEPDSVFHYRNPTFRLNLQANDVYTFYLFIDKTFSTSALPLYIWSAESFVSNINRKETSYGLLYGIFLVLIFQAVISGLYFRSKIYFFYFVYVLGLLGIVLVINGGFRMILPPEWHNAGYFSLYFCIFATFISLYLILFNLLNVKRDFPILYKIIIGKIILSVALLSVNTYAYFNLPDFPLKFYRNTNISIMLYPLFFIFICVRSYLKHRQGKALAFLVVFGLTMAFIFSFSLLPLIGYHHNNFMLFRWLIVFEGIIVLIILHRDLYYSKISTIQLQQKIIDQQDAISGSYLQGLSDERKRLSEQLHDSISTRLAALKMKLSHEQSKGSINIDYYNQELDNIHKELRATSHALSPVSLEKKGLIAAIEDEILKLEDTQQDLAINFNQLTQNIDLDKNIQEYIYWTFMELVGNTLKHAKANTIIINLKIENNHIVLEVEDNGIGFHAESDNHDGIGLKNIRSRAALAKGSFEVIQKEKGVIHRFAIPLGS